MRTTFSSIAIMASSLLAKEVFAAPHGHGHLHANLHQGKRDYYLDTDNVVVTEEVWVTKLPDGNFVTGAPKPVGTATIDGTASLVTEPTSTPTTATVQSAAEVASTSTSSTSSTTVAASSSSAVAVFIEVKSSSTPVAVSTPTTLATSVYVAPTTSSSTTSSAAASTSSSTSTSGKRGAAYNDVSLLSDFSSSSEVTWAYNWGSTISSGVPSSMEYVPMLWGLSDTYTSTWDSAVSTAKAAGSTHLLAFNEPDYSGQADLTASEAATGYKTYMEKYASDFKLVSPAVTNGGGSMGMTWMEEFISACSDCTIDAVAVHWYDGGSASDFKEYMASAYTKGGNRPLWVTEFQAPGSTTDDQVTFLKEVMEWMDETSYIERYAYFMVADGNLVSGSSLSTLGNTYATSS